MSDTPQRIRAETGWAGPYPVLYLEIDGQRAVLGLDQKRTLLNRYGVVFLGADWERKISVEIPADPEAGQPATTLRGFTDDPEIVRIYREWLAQHE